jgi:hypothetical protein
MKVSFFLRKDLHLSWQKEGLVLWMCEHVDAVQIDWDNVNHICSVYLSGKEIK